MTTVPEALRDRLLYGFIALLLLPALLSNLGLLAFIDDESIRALVALEMKLSGNYITPTLHGDYYYLKPPLYNWILLIFYSITGVINEFTSRLPTVFFLLLYGGSIYYFSRKHFDQRTAVLNALLFITCGRVLFWDSMLGLIDMCFSWLMFLLFMVIYQQGAKKRYLLLFLLSYLLTALGFLMKGLPAIVFQGITLLTYFIYKKEFKRLFSLPHILGGLLFLVLVCGYYALYHQYNSLENIWYSLFNESAKRTVVNYGWGQTILHLFTFPFEMIYHFLPWSLMILYFIRRDVLKVIRSNDFVFYSLLVFLANILLYWSSPEVYPRYLLMHAPLIFTAYLFFHNKHEAKRSWQWLFFDRLFYILLFVLFLGSFAPFFLEQTKIVSFRIPKTLALILLFLPLPLLYQKWKKQRLLIFCAALLVFRLGFDWFVLPDRNANDFGDLARQDALAVGEKHTEKNLYLYHKNYRVIFSGFYMTEKRREILYKKDPEQNPNALYIVDLDNYPEMRDYPRVDSFRIRMDFKYLYLVKGE
jgi:4-amino-4-deoxy-L-arabinose transferase-like glycosyltransferase